MTHEPGVERELKFADVDHHALRERLRSLEAEPRGSKSFEDNWIFDRGDDLRESDRLLRLRTDGRGARLTFKGPVNYDGRVKVRQEIETRVGDLGAMRDLLEALGYAMVRRYQKYREEWELGSVTIALDHTPIGDFAEFEGDGCETVARRCGLDAEDAERRNYLRLYRDYLKDHPDAPPDMVFEGKTDQGSGAGA